MEKKKLTARNFDKEFQKHLKKTIGKPMNYKKMNCKDLALMFKVSKDQGDKKEMNKIVKIYTKKGCIKK